MGYKMPYQEDCATCPHWGDWNSECDYFGYCPTRERIEQEREKSDEDDWRIGGAGYGESAGAGANGGSI